MFAFRTLSVSLAASALTISLFVMQGDYDGDGTTDLAVYQREGSVWKVKGQFELEFGESGDTPVPNDWAGLGRVIPAVFRTATGKWLAVDNLLSARYGQGGTPLVSGR